MNFRQARSYLFIFLLFFTLHFAEANEPVNSQDTGSSQENNPFYRTPEERREAGLGYRLTDWMKVALLLEMEREQYRYTTTQGNRYSEKSVPDSNVQVALEFNVLDSLEANLVLELQKSDNTTTFLEEAEISWDWNEWSISAGLLSPSFGEYYSHFIVGPMLEFGELRRPAISVDYSIFEQWEVGGFLIESQVDRIGDNQIVDWGLFTEWISQDESFRFGVSYLSDLSEGEESLIEQPNAGFQSQVGGINVYTFWGAESFVLTLEMVKALRSFSEFEPQHSRPWAANAELAYYPNDNLQLALRYEKSDELADAAKTRYGMSFRWAVAKNLTVAVDLLRARYEANGATDTVEDDANELALKQEQQVAAQITFAF